MKRLIYFTTLFSACFYFISCSKYSSYTEACYAGDFIEARKMLNAQKTDLESYRASHELVKVNKGLLKDDYDTSNQEKYEAMINDYLNAVQYVNMAEIRYVIDQGLDETATKVNYLLNEFSNQITEIRNKIIADFGQHDFYYNCNKVMPDSYDAIMKLSIDVDNFELAVSLLKYFDGFSLPMNVFTYLARKNNEAASDAILNYLSEMQPEGDPLPPGEQYYNTNSTHEKWVTKYNNQCMTILEVAISSSNQYLAEKVINLAKSNYKWTKKRNKRYLSFTNEDKQEMTNRYKEAIKDGAFNRER